MQDNTKYTGRVHIVHTDGEGKVLRDETVNNLVVNVGLQHIASRMNGNTAAVVSHVAIGSGTTAAAANQTALVSELHRNSATRTIVTQTISNDSIQMQVVFSPGEGTGSITEAGIFNAASAGTMLARTVFTAIPKGAADTITITWKVKVSA